MVKVGFYRGSGFISWLIRLRTWGQYSHCSIIFDNIVIDAIPFHGVESGGIEKLKDADIFSVNCTIEQTAIIRSFAVHQVGKPYDILAILKLAVNYKENRRMSEEWFCSELVTAALRKGGVAILPEYKAWEINPSMLSKSELLSK